MRVLTNVAGFQSFGGGTKNAGKRTGCDEQSSFGSCDANSDEEMVRRHRISKSGKTGNKTAKTFCERHGEIRLSSQVFGQIHQIKKRRC